MSRLDFSKIQIGGAYGRLFLAELWGFKSHFPISRGVVTPAASNQIILFVTKENQKGSPKYENYISDDYLYWDGEEQGGNDGRIIAAESRGDVIHLFYRHRHHTDFVYMGLVRLLSFQQHEGRPSTALYKILGDTPAGDLPAQVVIKRSDVKETERSSLVLSRVGQGPFRVDLIDIWKTCAVTNIAIPEILKASHIKPWRYSSNFERLDPYNGLLLSPNMDALFDRGFISFEDTGHIIISRKLVKQKDLVGVSEQIGLRTIFNDNYKYLDYHRSKILLR